jgi:dihydroflavonol-4-reductase
MIVLVTGVGGVLGVPLVRHLESNGFSVRALLDPDEDYPSLEGVPLKRVNGDVLVPESITEGLSGVQAVIHCASDLRTRPARSAEARALNYEGTRNLLVAMSRSGVEQLVHVGCASSFGPGAPGEPITEDTPYSGGRFRLDSYDSARDAQNLVLRFNETGKVRAVVVNPTLVIGRHGTPVGPGIDLFSFMSKHPGACPPGGANVISPADAARGILRAMGRGESGRCYILGGLDLEYRELLTEIAASVGRPPPDRDVSTEWLRRRGLLGSLAGRLVGWEPALTRETARLASVSFFYESGRANRELGFEPGPPHKAIEESALAFLGKG